MSNDRKALKSGVWYTAASFLRRGIGFLTTPIFTRLMTTEEFGLYSNYASWESIISTIIGLGLGATLIHARYEHEDDFDGYIFSMCVLNTISTLVWFIIIWLFNSFFTKTFSMNSYYLNVMCVTLLLQPVIDMYMDRERFFFEYKKSVLISVLLSVLTTGLSVVLVAVMTDRLKGRILGGILPVIPIGLGLFIFFFLRGKRVRVSYWKYALPVSLPYIPHVLSLILLSSMDRTMITRLCGPEDNAIYSLAYSVSSVITMLVGSMNSAFAPWIGEKLHEKKYGDINRVSRVYMVAFIAMASLIVLAALVMVRLPQREVSAEQEQRQLQSAADAYWKAQEENNRLRQLLAESDTRDFVERVARRDYGYCWYGETIYEVANLPEQTAGQAFQVYGQN